MKNKKLKAAVFGMGNRGEFYASIALDNPELLEIVQIVDRNETTRKKAQATYHLADEDCFASFEEWLKAPKKADVVFNTFMDEYHIETTMPLFERGYDVLLEKPISMHEEELNALRAEAKKYNKKLSVCHVLRYAPFYKKAKQLIAQGRIGDLITVEMAEHVYVPHMLASYVRGKWRSESECGSPMIMAKCCHDTDLMCWFNEGHNPVKVSSFGERSVFIPERKPADATDRCMTCPHKLDCIYSCYYNIKNKNMDPIVFRNAMEGKDWNQVTDEDKANILLNSDSLGRCAFDGPQDLVDHQQTIVTFDNGVTMSLNMVGGTSYPCRTLHVIGTKGEIFGVFEEGKVYLREYDHAHFTRSLKCYRMKDSDEGHGGGDRPLVTDFLRYVNTGKTSISQTNIDDSINGHLVGIAADISDKKGVVVTITKDGKFEY